MAKNTKNAANTSNNTQDRYSLLCYYITVKSGYPNPSALLRRCAFRVDGSVWVVKDSSTPWNVLNDMTDGGVDWKLFPFAAEGTAALIETCRNTLIAEIQDSTTRNAESLAAIQSRHLIARAAATNGRELEIADRKYGYEVKALNKRANQLLDDLNEAARVFGLDANGLGINAGLNAVTGLIATARAKAHLHTNTVTALANTPFAAAANANEIPAGIMADMIEENTGKDMTEVRKAFTETPISHEASNGREMSSSTPLAVTEVKAVTEWIDATQSKLFRYDVKNKVMEIRAADCKISILPDELNVTSHKTGVQTNWTLDGRKVDEKTGYTVHADYVSSDVKGWTLRLIYRDA